MTRALALSAAVFVASACATAPKADPNTTPQPAAQPVIVAPPSTSTTAPAGAFDPVGSYTFSVNTQGNTIGGSMNVRKGPDGKLGGEMTSDQGSLIFTWVGVEGRRMTATGILDNGPELTFVFDFAGDDFTGSLSAQGQQVGTLSGSRKKG